MQFDVKLLRNIYYIIEMYIAVNNIKELEKNLEQEANHMLEYMASNYLVANPAKTEYMVVNRVARDTSLDHITVEGYTVKAKKSVKVLGLQMTETLAWEGHFKELIKVIKQRLSIFYRTGARLPKACLGPIIHGIVVSKIRYGIVLYGGVRICDGDPVNKRNQQLQTIINNLARFVSGKRLKDRVSTENIRHIRESGSCSKNISWDETPGGGLFADSKP